MRKKSPPNYSVPALDKGLDVLEALAAASSQQTLTDLSRVLNRSSSVLFRILDALEKRAYIARDPISGAYHLTLKLYELGHTHSPVDQLLKAATLPMRELADLTHESCHIAVLAFGKLVVIAQALSPDRVRVSVEIGSQAPPLHTVSGRLLVAFLDPDAQQAFLESDADYLALSRTRKDALRADLKKIRRDGYTIAPSESTLGTDLAAIVGNPSVGVIASLAIPGLAGGRNQGKEKELLAPLCASAERITAALGLRRALEAEQGSVAE